MTVHLPAGAACCVYVGAPASLLSKQSMSGSLWQAEAFEYTEKGSALASSRYVHLEVALSTRLSAVKQPRGCSVRESG